MFECSSVPTGEAIIWYFSAMKATKAIDSIEDVLDTLNDMREELLSVERAIERIEAKRRDGPDGPGNTPASNHRENLQRPSARI